MASTSAQNPVSSYPAAVLCRIVGIACVTGFIVDMLVLALPPVLSSPEWRVGIMQQLGDRCIILLFGLALLIYGSLEHRRERKQLAFSCVVIGVVLLLSCIAVVRDGLLLHDLTVKNINTQVEQLQSQIQDRTTRGDAAAKATPEQLQEASRAIKTRVGSLKEGAKTSIFKTAIATMGNLVVIGLALVSLGYYGMHARKG